MKLYYSRAGVPAIIQAVQWTGDNMAAVMDLAGASGVATVAFFNKAIAGGGDDNALLIADRQFPFWLEAGEWLTRDDAGELDGWAERHFLETYTLQATEA